MTDLRSFVRTIPDYPKPGILFRDITTLLADGPALRRLIEVLTDRCRDRGIAKVAGIEARGFILGGALAERLGAGFVPIRKRGKLPAETIGIDYALEYGTDRLEVHRDAIAAGDRIILIDDLIATGGTALAALGLIRTLGGDVVEAVFGIDLPDLGGKDRIEAAGCPTFAVMDFPGH